MRSKRFVPCTHRPEWHNPARRMLVCAGVHSEACSAYSMRIEQAVGRQVAWTFSVVWTLALLTTCTLGRTAHHTTPSPVPGWRATPLTTPLLPSTANYSSGRASTASVTAVNLGELPSFRFAAVSGSSVKQATPETERERWPALAPMQTRSPGLCYGQRRCQAPLASHATPLASMSTCLGRKNGRCRRLAAWAALQGHVS